MKAKGSSRKGQRVKEKERGLWHVGYGTLFFRRSFFFVSGEQFVEQGRGLWDARARDGNDANMHQKTPKLDQRGPKMSQNGPNLARNTRCFVFPIEISAF